MSEAKSPTRLAPRKRLTTETPEMLTQLRLEEGYAAIKAKIEQRQDPSQPLFNDFNAKDFIPLKLLYKEIQISRLSAEQLLIQANNIETVEYCKGEVLDAKNFGYILITGTVKLSIRKQAGPNEISSGTLTPSIDSSSGGLEGMRLMTQRGFQIGPGKFINHQEKMLTPYLTAEHYENLDDLCYTVASDTAKLLRQTKEMLLEQKKANDTQQKVIKIDEFLRSAIHTYASQSKKGRQNVSSSFTWQEHCAGVTLIREGQPNTSAFLIMSGECKLLKKSNGGMTAQGSPSTSSFKIPSKNDSDIFKKGLDAKEAAQYQLGIRSSGSWVGEEILFLRETQPFPYSVVARSPVIVLQNVRSEMLRLLHPEVLTQLIDQSQNRFKLLKEQTANMDRQRETIGRTSSFSVFDKYTYETKRKAHLDKVELDQKLEKSYATVQQEQRDWLRYVQNNMVSSNQHDAQWLRAKNMGQKLQQKSNSLSSTDRRAFSISQQPESMLQANKNYVSQRSIEPSNNKQLQPQQLWSLSRDHSVQQLELSKTDLPPDVNRSIARDSGINGEALFESVNLNESYETLPLIQKERGVTQNEPVMFSSSSIKGPTMHQSVITTVESSQRIHDRKQHMVQSQILQAAPQIIQDQNDYSRGSSLDKFASKRPYAERVRSEISGAQYNLDTQTTVPSRFQKNHLAKMSTSQYKLALSGMKNNIPLRRDGSSDQVKTNRANFLYSSMKRQYTNLKESDQEKSFSRMQKLKNPLLNMSNVHQEKSSTLRPADPFSKKLPPQYQAHLEDTYNQLVSKAMSKSTIMTVNSQSSNPYKAKSHLTNADAYAMKKNHKLLAAKIGESPHHFFQIEHTTPECKRPGYVKPELTERIGLGQIVDPRKSYASEQSKEKDTGVQSNQFSAKALMTVSKIMPNKDLLVLASDEGGKLGATFMGSSIPSKYDRTGRQVTVGSIGKPANEETEPPTTGDPLDKAAISKLYQVMSRSGDGRDLDTEGIPTRSVSGRIDTLESEQVSDYQQKKQKQPNSLSRVPPYRSKKHMPSAFTLRNSKDEKKKTFQPIFVQEFPVKINQIMVQNSIKKKN